MGRKHHRDQSTGRPFRLVIEQLETRQLLAGLNVWVYSDLNGSRSFETTMDSPAANRLVYVDLDEDGVLGPHEPLAVTDDVGLAEFRDLAPGRYQVSLVNSNPAQAQAFPTSVNSDGQLLLAQPAAQVISTRDLSRNWLVSADGRARILDGIASAQTVLDLGGELTSVTEPVGGLAWGVVKSSSGARLMRLDLNQSLVENLPIERASRELEPVSVTRIGEQLALILQTNAGRILATTTRTGATLTWERELPLPADATVVGSPAGNGFAITHSPSPTKSVVALHSTDGNSAAPQMIEVDSRIQRVHFTSDGRFLLASTEDRGVLAFEIAAGRPRLVADLREASEPIAVHAIDGRFVSGNRIRPNELIVWDTENWQPTGRVSIGNSDNAETATRISSVAVDRWGSRLLTTTTTGTYEANLSVPRAQSVVVSNNLTAQIQFGVRAVGRNTQPVAPSAVSRSAIEDTIDRAPATELVQFLRDADGNVLWFTLDAIPRHGRLELTNSGEWRYIPSSNFHGQDFAVIRAHDGISSSSPITVNIDVAAVNDPPTEMRTHLVPVPENAAGQTSIGFVTVFDPDRDAQYDFTSSDPRFVVKNGEIRLREGGSLDFEAHRQIAFEITARDVDRPEHSITRSTTLTVEDVNEPPLGLYLSKTQTSENQSGREIGAIIVDDPDGTSELIYTVSDGRFEVVNGLLRLRADAELDYESESQVTLVVSGAPAEVGPPDVSSTITIIVADQNDPPTGITLVGREILSDQEGYVIGTVTVHDQDSSDSYEIFVSDPRFEVTGRRLKLRDDQYISIQEGETVLITIYAMAQNGDFVSENFTLTVKAKSNSHHNVHNSLDVNNDGFVSAMDALILINYLNQNGPQELGPNQESGEGEPTQFIDVNNDGAVSPIDVLIIINHINNAGSQGVSGEGEARFVDSHQRDAFHQVADSHEDGIDDSKLDFELETLLEQLSGERIKRRRG